MTEIGEIFQRIGGKLQADPRLTKGLAAVYQFQFHDDGSVFQLILNGENSRIEKKEAESPQCTLVMTKEDFIRMTEGNLNGTKAFMSGRLKIKGDMGLALKLQDLFASFRKAANG